VSESFSIKSSQSDRELVFSQFDEDYFYVALKGRITGAIKVYGYAPHTHDLLQWFKMLGGNKKPWSNEIAWESLEGELRLSATCSALGEVSIYVALIDQQGADEESRIQTALVTELGQLPNISKSAIRFFLMNAPNKGIQSDLLKRYALSSAADAGRYVSLER